MTLFAYPTEPELLNDLEVAAQRALRWYQNWPDGPACPTPDQWKELLDCCFAASLESEEHRNVVFTLAFFREPDRSFPYRMHVPLSPRNLARMSVALDAYRSRICVVPSAGGLAIGGLIHLGEQHTFDGVRQVLHKFSVRVLGPGIILVRCGEEPLFSYRRGQVRFWGGDSFGTLEHNRRIMLSFRVELGTTHTEAVANLLFRRMDERIARIMLSHGHGGTMLSMPAGTRWQAASEPFHAMTPVTTVRDAFAKRVEWEVRRAELLTRSKGKELPKDPLGTTTAQHLWSELEWLGRLTATDGMTVIDRDLTLLGFGVFFDMQEPGGTATMVKITDLSTDRTDPEPKPLSAVGGARHQSAAVTCRRYPGAVAIVSSQDGSLTSMRCEGNFVTVNRHLELLLDL